MSGVRKAVLLLVGLGLLVSGCGVRPSGVIRGNAAPTGPAYGVYLYFADSSGRLTAVLRPTNRSPSPSDTLAMLVGGPDSDEQAQGFRTELPPALGPVELATGLSGITITVAVDVQSLSTVAVGQLVCTAHNSVAGEQLSAWSTQVTLTGGGHSLWAQDCPLAF